MTGEVFVMMQSRSIRAFAKTTTSSATAMHRKRMSWMFILFLLIQVSCVNEEQLAKKSLNAKFQTRMHSLSPNGSKLASLIIDETGELRLTTDAGLTWLIIPGTAVGNGFACATLIDNERGWAVNRKGQVFATRSGGRTWAMISALHDFTGANQIEFFNENDGWIREFLSIWRTQDGGVTWRETLSTVTPGVGGQPTGMFVIDAKNVIVSGSGGQVYVTNDGGSNWKIETPVPGNIDFNDVCFVDQNHGWLAGYQVIIPTQSGRPLLLETTDGGDSWREVSLENDVRPSSIYFVGEQGWLVGSRRVVNGESIELFGVSLSTRDGGKTWTQAEVQPGESFFTEVRFADQTHGWLVGRDALYYTEDGGTAWKPVLSLPAVQ